MSHPPTREGWPAEAGVAIREATPEDDPHVAALEAAAPDIGTWRLRIQPTGDTYALAWRYPNTRGYVAVLAKPDAIRGGAARSLLPLAGMLFGSTAPTRVNGDVVPGLYLFALRVHPACRRQGVASALIARAWEDARRRADVRIAWAVVADGNVASLRAFGHAGFEPASEVAVRVLVPWRSPLRGTSGWAGTVRRATADDLDVLAECLNAVHVTHDLWRPVTPNGLARDLTGAGHTLGDVLVAPNARGTLLAAGAPLHLDRLARVRFAGHTRLPTPVRAALAPILGRAPLRLALLRYRLLYPEYAAAGEAVLRGLRRSAGRGAFLAVPLDRRDLAWAVAEDVPGLTGRVHVVTRGTAIGQYRPLYVG